VLYLVVVMTGEDPINRLSNTESTIISHVIEIHDNIITLEDTPNKYLLISYSW
jgi:hypothetical protein